jgi:superfamily II DNA or RNA helicase
MTPRGYQTEARDAILSAWGEKPWHKEGETFRSVLINLATSAGKTVIAGLTIDAVKDRGKCLFLADTDELCDQPMKKFTRLFGMRPALDKASDKASRFAEVVIGSAQTLIREDRMQRYHPNHFGYIFVDEAHRGSDRNKKITDYFSGAKLAGQTATAFRKKLADLSPYYDHVAYELGMFDLIDEGYMTPYKVLTLPVNVDISKVKQTKGDYDETELDTTIAPYYEEIGRLIQEHAANRFIIAYLPLIKSSQDFVAILQKMGIKAHHVDGKSPNRRARLEAFERGEFNVLSNSSLLTTGWDCPRVDCLLNLTPTRSVGLYRQKAGRLGRLMCEVEDLTDRDARKARIAASPKPDALILDLLWQTEKFGLVGPADLIAANQDERLAIQIKIAGLTEPRDLQDVTAETQEEREQALKKALEDAARRQARATLDINLIAATIHGRKVLNYEPVMKWERQPITDKQRGWMLKNGIDPNSAKDRGHISALMNLLFQRQRLGLGSHRVVKALEKRQVKNATQVKDWTAYQILGGDYPFPFGKHALQNHTLKQVPSGYYEWCGEQDWINQFPIVADWIDRTTKGGSRKVDCTCIGAYQAPNCPVHPRGEKPAHLAHVEIEPKEKFRIDPEMFENLEDLPRYTATDFFDILK